MDGEDDEVVMLIATMKARRGGPGVRAQAARLLGASGDPRAIEPLLDQIEDTADPFKTPVVTAVLDALPAFGLALAAPLHRLLDGPDDPRRKYVPRLLLSATGADAAPTLSALLDDRDEDVVMNAATALGALHDPAYAPALLQVLDDEARPALMRGVAASALGMTGASNAYNVLAPLLGSSVQSLVAGAIDGLAELGDPRAIGVIQALLAADRLDERTRRGARLALISLRAPH